MSSGVPDAGGRSTTEVALQRQRALAERLLLGALRSQDVARRAVEAEQRAGFLASSSRALSGVVEQTAIRDIVRHCVLPRRGSWSIVDIIESNGDVARLAAVHPNPDKQALAQALEGHWPANDSMERSLALAQERVALNAASGDALLIAANGAANLDILRQIGFGELLAIPLTVNDRVLGKITFVTAVGDPPLTGDEIALAGGLAESCAFALENARLYADADELRAAADAANRAKSIFLGNMTHELLTPLNAIGGYVDLLEMELRGPVTPAQQADLARIKHSQQHLLGLIKGILEYVHSDTGGLHVHAAPVKPARLMRDIAEMLSGSAAERHLVIDVHPNESGAEAFADPVRVRKILVNLVTNAIKYSAVGDGPITLSTSAGPKTMSILVTDSGPGIPPEQLTAIFQPFVQLAAGLTNRQGGVGLGLAISRDLAAAMNGTLTAESTVGEGSTFTLTLPRWLGTE